MKATAPFKTGISTAVLLVLGFLTPAVQGQSLPTTKESGTASYYADKYHGRPTASGEIFDMHQLTAAHPTLKFGTVVKVTNTLNHRSVVVRINDRGPFAGKRVIDLSLAAATELQMVREGLAPVTIEIVGGPTARK